ncbi:hypothetical protein DRQ33_01520 [bacterium]|nr:MAG: hypothetical protein DRQ33_01520 [bacterium]
MPEWYYPDTVKKTLQLIRQDNTIIHAGGTFILKRNLGKLDGIVDIHRLPLNYIHNNDDYIELGGLNTYSTTIDKLKQIAPEHILIKSLFKAASPPLRNRITLCGSIRAFPIWSDIIGPLIASEAQLILATDLGEKIIPIDEYLAEIKQFKNALILAVRIPKDNWQSKYIRPSRTTFDYSAFNISILWKGNSKNLEDIRIVIVGNSKKYFHPMEFEKVLLTNPINKIELAEQIKNIDIKFGNKNLGNGNYIRKLFDVMLERAIAEI